MVIAPGKNGVAAVVILADGEFLPENLNSTRVIVFRRGDSTDRQLKLVKPLGELASTNLLKKSEAPVCSYLDNIVDNQPIHQHADGKYWFYEPNWTFEQGPFDNSESAYLALEAYCTNLEKTKQELKNVESPS